MDEIEALEQQCTAERRRRELAYRKTGDEKAFAAETERERRMRRVEEAIHEEMTCLECGGEVENLGDDLCAPCAQETKGVAG